jgi:hypothetical protein
MRELWQRAHVGDPGNTQIPLLYEWHHGYGGGRKMDDAKAEKRRTNTPMQGSYRIDSFHD